MCSIQIKQTWWMFRSGRFWADFLVSNYMIILFSVYEFIYKCFIDSKKIKNEKSQRSWSKVTKSDSEVCSKEIFWNKITFEPF